MKKLVLLPLAALFCFSIVAAEWLPMGSYNYYYERPWIPPQTASYVVVPPEVQTYDYNYYIQRHFTNPWSPNPIPVARTVTTVAVNSNPFAPPRLASRPASFYPGTNYDYHLRELDWSGARPITGYRDLEWGTPMYQFLRHYPDAVEVTTRNDAIVNVRRFVQRPINQSIESRQFVFSQDRLYEVYVLHGYVDNYTSQYYGEKMITLYGTPITTNYRESRTERARFAMADNYMNYNHNLQVVYTVADAYNYYDQKLGTFMTTLYTNLPIRAEVERARLNYGWTY
jgi:hypothetical protein